MSIFVSIIIPCYNVQEYVEECVISAFNQTYKNIEVICIDNNSSDNTWGVLQKIKVKFPDLILSKESKPGATAARNKGVGISKGEWLQFLDADDLLLPDKITHQIQLIDYSEKYAFIAGSCYKYHCDGKKTIHRPLKDFPFKSLIIPKLGNTITNLWNKQILIDSGAWNPEQKSSQEAELMFRILKTNNRVIFDNEPLAIVREREIGQISKANPYQNWKRYLELRLQIYDYVKIIYPDYYISEKSFFDNTIFSLLKMESNFSVISSTKLYKKHLQGSFETSNFHQHSTWYYMKVFKVMGFKNTEILRKLINSLKT